MINYLIAQVTINANKLPHVTPTSDGTIRTVLSFFLGAAGAITLLIIGIAGLRYTISRGNPDAIKTSKEIIIYALVGLVIVMAAYGIVQFVFKGVTN